MEIKRIDLVALFDLDFRQSKLSSDDLATLRSNHELGSEVGRLYKRSGSWLFYGQELTGYQRFNLSAPKESGSFKGSSILVHPGYGAGVFSVWRQYEAPVDVLAKKQEAWIESQASLDRLRSLNLNIEEIERYYPFLAVHVDTNDLPGMCKDTGVQELLGRFFTGNLEDEETPELIEYCQNNLSRRKYERLYLRWTDALGVYSTEPEADQIEQTMFRAVRIFEYCILLRRLLRNIRICQLICVKG